MSTFSRTQRAFTGRAEKIDTAPSPTTHHRQWTGQTPNHDGAAVSVVYMTHDDGQNRQATKTLEDSTMLIHVGRSFRNNQHAL